MIDKKLFDLVLSKCNDTTINTQGVEIKGNYVFVRMNDTQTMMEASAYNPYDLKRVQYIAMAETVSQPTEFVEENNRTAWIKQYTFQFPLRMKDKALEALQEVYLYFRANKVQSIADDVTYKTIFKVGRPRFIGNQSQAGTISITYTMDFFCETVETGYYGNEASITMKLDGTSTITAGSFIIGDTYKIKVAGTTDFTLIGAADSVVGTIFTATGVGTGTGTADVWLQDLIFDSVTIASAVATDPSNILTAEQNTDNKVVSRGTNITMDLYYDSTSLLETLYKSISGKHTREQIFDITTTFDSIVQTYEVKVASGSVVMQKGVVIMLKLTLVES